MPRCWVERSQGGARGGGLHPAQRPGERGRGGGTSERVKTLFDPNGLELTPLVPAFASQVLVDT